MRRLVLWVVLLAFFLGADVSPAWVAGSVYSRTVQVTAAISGSGTVGYAAVGSHNINHGSNACEIPAPIPSGGVLRRLRCGVTSGCLTGSQTVEITLNQQNGCSFPTTGTGLTCTMNSTNSCGCSDTTGSATILPGNSPILVLVKTSPPTMTNFFCTYDVEVR